MHIAPCIYATLRVTKVGRGVDSAAQRPSFDGVGRIARTLDRKQSNGKVRKQHLYPFLSVFGILVFAFGVPIVFRLERPLERCRDQSAARERSGTRVLLPAGSSIVELEYSPRYLGGVLGVSPLALALALLLIFVGARTTPPRNA